MLLDQSPVIKNMFQVTRRKFIKTTLGPERCEAILICYKDQHFHNYL